MAAEHRVFFALWPDDETARRFADAGRRAGESLGGRRMRRETLHLTLAFIGNIAPGRLAALQDIAGTICLPSFELAFDRLQCLPRKGIAWALASVPSATLLELVDRLNLQLRAGGFRTESRPFATHVTLLRKADCPAGLADEGLKIAWPVRDFVLAESVLGAAGARYRILARWPLGQT